MTAPLVTLTTDFGPRSPYVAAMKGALLAVNPAVQLIDLSHSLPPQDLQYCSWFLQSAVPYFPPGTLHVVVVDPGVGTGRDILLVELGGQRLLVPDNGCWTGLLRQASDRPRVFRVIERSLWHAQVSATFHGRDIFAPVAGHLSLGSPAERVGPEVKTWIDLQLPSACVKGDALDGEVVFIDDFGNLLSNVAGEEVRRSSIASITVGSHRVERLVRSYGEAPPGSVVALISSADTLEVAEVHGSAARRLGVTVGTPVRVLRRVPSDTIASAPP
jgi:S-adenosyl-L-methionine hydrolase (adenosine-forming)